MNFEQLFLAAVIGFACGSIPFAVLIARAFGLQDPRSYGSKNPGATNVMRSGNKYAAYLVFLGDSLKSLIPTMAWQVLVNNPEATAACGMAAVAGHIWSPWLRFRGGRGVATGVGAYVGMHWLLGSLFGFVWPALFFTTRTSSIASVGAFVAVMVTAFFYFEPGDPISIATSAIALVVVLRHRQNLKDLLRGKERKF